MHLRSEQLSAQTSIGRVWKLLTGWYLGMLPNHPLPTHPFVICVLLPGAVCGLTPGSRRRYGHLTWEWAAGLRSYAHPLLFALPFQLLAWMGLDSPATLPASALVMQSALAAATDVSVFRLAKAQFGQQAARCCCASAVAVRSCCDGGKMASEQGACAGQNNIVQRDAAVVIPRPLIVYIVTDRAQGAAW